MDSIILDRIVGSKYTIERNEYGINYYPNEYYNERNLMAYIELPCLVYSLSHYKRQQHRRKYLYNIPPLSFNREIYLEELKRRNIYKGAFKKTKFSIYKPLYARFYKYLQFHKYIERSILLNEDDYDKMMNIYRQYQRLHFAVMKVQELYRRKYRYKIYDCMMDMNMTPLNELPKKNVIQLVENNTVYMFSIHDLIKVINTQLNSSKMLVLDPKIPKNPYTNLPFSYHNLYNIYFHCLFISQTYLPYYIHSYFQLGQNMDMFMRYNILHLRKKSVVEYIESSSKEEIIDELLDMFYVAKHKFQIIERTIDEGFSRDEIYAKCKYLLYDYLLLECISQNDPSYIYAYGVFKSKIMMFFKINENFGRCFTRKNTQREDRRVPTNNVYEMFMQELLHNEEIEADAEDETDTEEECEGEQQDENEEEDEEGVNEQETDTESESESEEDAPEQENDISSYHSSHSSQVGIMIEGIDISNTEYNEI